MENELNAAAAEEMTAENGTVTGTPTGALAGTDAGRGADAERTEAQEIIGTEARTETSGGIGAEDAILQRAWALTAQAEAIRRVSGKDVMALFETDVDIRGRVLAGEMDFVDVWQSLGGSAAPPAPVRSANGGTGAVNVAGMSAGQFERLNRMLA